MCLCFVIVKASDIIYFTTMLNTLRKRTRNQEATWNKLLENAEMTPTVQRTTRKKKVKIEWNRAWEQMHMRESEKVKIERNVDRVREKVDEINL